MEGIECQKEEIIIKRNQESKVDGSTENSRASASDWSEANRLAR